MVSSIDVAKHAGVSQTTVSRVMNRPDKVDQKTLEKVRKAMEELNYRPNAAARSLAGQKTKSITLLSGPLDHPIYAELASSVTSAAEEAGYGVNLVMHNPSKSLNIEYAIERQQVEGLIITAAFTDPVIMTKIKKMNIPFLSLTEFDAEKQNGLAMNNIQAGKTAARHLLDLGHKEIVWISGPLENPIFSGRLEGFIQELEKEQHPLNPENLILAEEEAESVWEITKNLMAKKGRPTAILAGNDMIALQVMDFLLDFGYDIPDDISIMGIDNMKIARHRAFNLSSVGIAAPDDVGKLAIENLTALIEGKAFPKDRIIQETATVKLFARGSATGV